MKPGPFMENLILTLAMLAGANYLIYLWHKPLRLEFVNRLETEQPIQTLVIGDSTMAAGFYGEDFKEVWREQTGETTQTYNAAIGNSTAIGQYLALRKAFRHHPEIERVILGVIGFRLTDPHVGPAESVARNVFLEYYLEPEAAAPFHAELRPFGRARFAIERRIPMFVERNSFWVEVEKARRTAGSWGLPRKASNEFGRVDDFRNFIYPDLESFLAHCNDATTNRRPLWSPIARMIEECRERDVELAVAFMPMSRKHRELFHQTPEWRRYIAYVRGLLQTRGVTVVDAGDWLTLPDDAAIPDNLHMVAEAGQQFSRRLAAALSRK